MKKRMSIDSKQQSVLICCEMIVHNNGGVGNVYSLAAVGKMCCFSGQKYAMYQELCVRKCTYGIACNRLFLVENVKNI